MALAIPLETPPMEARLTDEIPTGEGWQFEPKWDGFRCLAFRDGGAVELRSKSGAEFMKSIANGTPSWIANSTVFMSYPSAWQSFFASPTTRSSSAGESGVMLRAAAE
jgi:hypothetical protein